MSHRGLERNKQITPLSFLLRKVTLRHIFRNKFEHIFCHSNVECVLGFLERSCFREIIGFARQSEAHGGRAGVALTGPGAGQVLRMGVPRSLGIGLATESSHVGEASFMFLLVLTEGMSRS